MIGELEDATLAGNERIEEVIHLFYQDQTPELLMAVCLAVRERMAQDGHLLFPADISEDEDGNTMFSFKTLPVDGVDALVAFTSLEEKEKGPASGGVSQFIDCMLEPLMEMEEIGGLLLNPWGESLLLGKEEIAVILNPGIERFM